MADPTPHMRAHRILVVDDDRELCELLVEYLQRESFAVECAHDGAAGLARAADGAFDVMILDVMLPELTGFELLRRLRRTSAIPVLMLTARGEEVDRIVGLELGADDYLPKPFNPRELVARIHAILRRTTHAGAQADGDARGGEASSRLHDLSVHDLTVHVDRREATYAGQPIALTTVEFDVLHLLAAASGRVVSRGEISKVALGRPYTAYDRSVDMHVMNLRRKLQVVAGERVQIKTVRSAGYLLVVEPGGAAPRPRKSS
jgi:two-component system, OmpR family, response regulator CpxR